MKGKKKKPPRRYRPQRRNSSRRFPINAEKEIPKSSQIITPEKREARKEFRGWSKPLPKNWKDVDPRKVELVEKIFDLMWNGITVPEACEKVGYSMTSFNRMRKRYPHLQEIYEGIRETNIDLVEDSLMRSALGYEYESTKETRQGKRVKEDGKTVLKDVKVTIVKETHRVAPNTTAAIFFLKNRAKARWRSDQNLTIEHNVNGSARSEEINVTPKEKEEKDRRFLESLSPAARREVVLAMVAQSQEGKKE